MEELLGAILSLAAGLAFSFREITLRVGMIRADPFTGVFISILMSLAVGAVFGAVSGDFGRSYEWNLHIVLYFALAGILHFLVGRYFIYLAIKLIGASRSATFQNSNLVFSALMGVVFLNEVVTLPLLTGIILISAGVTLISLRGREEVVELGRLKRLPILKGLALSLLGSVFFAVTQVLTRVGVVEFGSAIIGNIVSTFAALLASLPVLAFAGGFHRMLALDSRTTRLLTVSGLLAGLAQIFRYISLAVAPIVFVAPLIIGGYTLLTIALSYLFIRRLERVGWRLVLGAILTVAGTVMVLSP